jgi:C-terminal processing protease CtpA/Prc
VDYSSIGETLNDYYRSGFVLIGESIFKGVYFDKKLAIPKAKEIGATHILHYAKYNKDIRYKKAVILPNSTTSNQYANINSNTNGSANLRLNDSATGNSIYGNVYGKSNTYTDISSNTHTSGYKTELVDSQYSEYDQGAGYLVKANEDFIKFGVLATDIPDEIKNKLQTNKGFGVGIVVRNSPAYIADILEGDIILSANGKGIYSYESFYRENLGKRVDLEIYRNGEYVQKVVTLKP